ncbi:MAG: flagellar assembly peptidoglycan hydrolase FlgJ [Gammaproteobacteria bacterium]|nr:flagellar assembly peptidoglycan hydrolase FlgJ [Gammaproteobacteria bacterium]
MMPALAAANVYTDFNGLTGLKASAGAAKDDPVALRAVAKQFEALFLQMVLKSMRNASLGEGAFDSDQSRLYRDMFDQQISTSMSTKGIGIADMLVRQLDKSVNTQSQFAMPSPLGRSSTLPLSRNSSAQSVRAVAVADTASVSVATKLQSESELDGSAQSFIKTLLPHAQRVAKTLGVVPEVLLAQSALETGWGQFVARHPEGQSSYNLFGIKAGAGWTGKEVTVGSYEFIRGTAVKQSSAFRSYGSYAESFDDYARFLRTNNRYDGALEKAADPKAYARALQDAGYATDPHYARKIGNILDGDVLPREIHRAQAAEQPPRA